MCGMSFSLFERGPPTAFTARSWPLPERPWRQAIHWGLLAVPSNFAVVLKGSYFPVKAADLVFVSRADIYKTPGRRRARRRHTGWRREYFRTGRHCAPTNGARVAGVANGIVVQVVQAGERQATRWAHLYLRYRVRSGNMSRGSFCRARRRPPWIVSPVTRNSLAGAARLWPIIEAQSTRCSARQDFAPY